jgi:hypothetical protein
MPRKTVKRLFPLALVIAACALHVPAAGASSTQVSIFQDDVQLKSDPVDTLAVLHSLGVDRVRVDLTWSTVAPNPRSSKAPRGFNASNPGSYPASGWAPYDAIVRDAHADGISVMFTVTSPVPRWAEPRSIVIAGVTNPSPKAFGAFMHAVGQRYSGSYKPRGASSALPRVSYWSLWNEPNYSVQLAPQTNGNGSEVFAASEYRGLLAAAWGGLAGTGHVGRDTILIGELAPRGSNGVPGSFGGTKPLTFLRALYCVDSRYRELRGSAARAIGCPTTAGASRRFRAQNAALFQASGVADHPYTLQGHPVAPNVPTNFFGGGKSDPNYTDLPEIGRLEGVLNHLTGIYGSHKHFPIYNTEYGYRTRPPDHVGVSQATQALWMNWAEYLSYKQPGIASFDQYLLRDPANGQFASGLELPNATQKLSFDAYRLPLFLPSTSTTHGKTLEVWGAVRPAHTVRGTQSAQIQFEPPGGSYTTVDTVPITNPQGYFDVHVAFPSSGNVRIAWASPSGCGTGTGVQPCIVGPLFTSRTQSITIH